MKENSLQAQEISLQKSLQSLQGFTIPPYHFAMLLFCCRISRGSAWCLPRTKNSKNMLRTTKPQPTPIIQYVVAKDDLEEVINGIVEAKLESFFEAKKQEAKSDELLTPKEVTEILGVNLTTLWRWHNEGYLTKVYIGDKPRYRQSDIDRILKKGGEK